MDISKSSGNICVILVGMDAKKEAIFRMAFKMHATTHYVIWGDPGVAETPQVAIIDVDGPEGMGAWDNFRQKHPQMLVLMTSVTEPDESIPYLPKPVKIETLFPILRALLEGSPIPRLTTDTNKNRYVAQKDRPQEEEITTPRFQRTQSLESENIQVFSDEGGFLGALHKASSVSQDVAITYQGKPVVLVFNSIGKIVLAAKPDVVRSMCVAGEVPLDIQVIPDKPEWKERAKVSIYSLLWQAAVWSANGRLLNKITPTTTMTLTQWPNLTRVAHIGDAIRLSAFMSQTKTNLKLLYRLMDVDVVNMLNFIAASYATGTLKIGADAEAATIYKNRGGISANEKPVVSEAENEVIKPRYKGQSVNMMQLLMKRLSDKK